MSNANANKSNQNTATNAPKVEVAHNVDAAQTETLQPQTTHGKLMEMVKELTGLNENEVLKLGMWVIQSKDALIVKEKEAFDKKLGEEAAFNSLLADAPVKPDYKVVVSQIEGKLFALLEKACVIIDTWISPSVGKEVREGFVKHYNEFKAGGESTDWKLKFENLRGKLQVKATELTQIAELTPEVKKVVETVKEKVTVKHSPAAQEMIAKYGFIPDEVACLV